MKAIRVHKPGDPDVLQYEDAPDPQLKPGQVLIRIKAAGVNPVDTYIRAGRYAQMPPFPYIPGGDAAGVIEAVAAGVQRVKVGDRVYTAGGNARLLNGCYAELLACDADLVCPLAAPLSFAQGAAVGVNYATAARALHHKARAIPGETLFIHGASGGVGVAAIQLGRAHGLRIIGTAMMRSVIPQSYTVYGMLLWLGVVIVLSVIASILPARNAARLTIREVLAYE